METSLRTGLPINLTVLLTLVACALFLHSGVVAAEPETGRMGRLSQTLAALSAAERMNTEINLALSESDLSRDHRAAEQVERLWKQGQHDLAIAALRAFETSGVGASLGISWLNPRPAAAPTKSLGGVTINSETGVDEVVTDYHAASGNLFAAIAYWQDEPLDYSISISTNGTSWGQTYFAVLGDHVGFADFDMVVVGDFVYVAYVDLYSLTQVKLIRFFAATGIYDAAFDIQTITTVPLPTVGTDLPTDNIALASNRGGADDIVYLALIQNADNTIRFFWDQADDGTTFTETSTPVTNAGFGLDLHRNDGTSVGVPLYASYFGTDGTVNVMPLTLLGWGSPAVVESGAGPTPTAVSAYQDTVIVTYLHDYGAHDYGCRYRISYDAGSHWSLGDFPPDGPGTFFSFCDVTAASGDGIALTYIEATSGSTVTYRLFFRFRGGYTSGAWNEAVPIGTADAASGAAQLTWLDPIESWGVGAVGAYPDRRPYFISVGGIPIFGDGFESGDTSQWAASVP